MYRIICLLLALMMVIPACAEEKYSEFPKALRMTQKRVKNEITDSSYIMTHYPRTNVKTVDAALEEALDALTEENRPYLPRKSSIASESAMIDTCPTVYRTGTKWASFLMVSSVMEGGKQLRMNFDTRVYDMETGAQLTLNDVLLPSGLPFVQEEAKKQLAALFPQYEADEEKLLALCTEESILSAHFTVSPAFLQLHFDSSVLYDHEGVIMHVRIPHTQLTEYLTAEAKVQTDNSRYKLVALTYDDGPTRRRTLNIIRSLRTGGQNATFFVVGERMANATDMILLEHNSGFTVASHNYYHVYTGDMAGKVQAYRDMFNEELCALTGSPLTMMRAPGGQEQIYIDENVGLPLIHWSLASKDGKSDNFDVKEEAKRIVYSLVDGTIVLMHDLRAITAEYTSFLPLLLNERGFMCVTVDELFALRGIPLESNTVYMNAPPQAQ